MAERLKTYREALEWFDGLAEDDPVKHEFEAFVYTICARAAWRQADLLRAAQRRRSHSERMG
jgi:hypothetical protein